MLELERGAPRIVPPAAGQVALVYPNRYPVGMSNLGYQMVYRWINEHRGALAERFFCEGTPALSVETQRPLEQFDIVAFSIAYELDYLEAVRFLLRNKISVYAAERDPKAEPVVVAGGICMLVNRLPIYDLADVLVLGDGEGTVARLMDEWVESSGDRARFMQAIAAIEGVELTEGGARRFGLDRSVGRSPEEPFMFTGAFTAEGNPISKIQNPKSEGTFTDTHGHMGLENPKSKIENPKSPPPHFVRPLDTADAYSMIVTPYTEFGDRCLVEIARGCPYRCRFCFIGHLSPCRPRPFEAVREMIERGRRLTNRFGLIAPAVGSHPDIERICEWCLREGVEVSFSSLRLEDVTPAMIELLVAGRQQSVTVAPEAGSERLRRQSGKRMSDAQIVAFAADAVARGLTELRLYFMLGLPGEDDEDVEAITRLVERVRRTATAARKPGQRAVRVAVNAAIFIPKPGTPLAVLETPPASQIKARLRRLGSLLGKLEGVEFRMPGFAEAEAQKLLTWAGRDVLRALIETVRQNPTSRQIYVGLLRSDG